MPSSQDNKFSPQLKQVNNVRILCFSLNLPNGNEIRYNVDALNRRVAKMINGTYEYKLLYSGQLSPTCRPKSCTKVPTARLDADDRVVEEYVYGSVADLSAAQLWQVEGYGPQVGTRVNVPDYIIKDGAKYRVITDHRGSVRFVVDTHSGEVMQETEYTEFGQIISETLAEDWEPVLFGYAGGLQDRDTGLIRFGARDYDPETARWTSKEPLGFNGADNFYIYAENDPVNLVDITGLDTFGVGFNISLMRIARFEISVQLIGDTQGNIGFSYSYGNPFRSGGVISDVSASIQYSYTNAPNIDALGGEAVEVGGSANIGGSGLNVGAEIVLADEYKGVNLVCGFSDKSVLKVNPPFELHGTSSTTRTHSVDINVIYDYWINFFK